jgi:hypothetical protein
MLLGLVATGLSADGRPADMKSSYQIFKGDFGISFYRTDTNKTSKVSIINDDARFTLATYKFRNIPADTFMSPYISWANLNCCNGWRFDTNYLLTAVQDDKKLCSGMTFNDGSKLEAYIENLDAEYPYFCPPPTQNGQQTYFHIDVTRKGSISDYIDIGKVEETYVLLEIDFLEFDKVRRYANMPMISLLDGTADFDYANPKGGMQFVVTGLLLGYPIESTAAFLTGMIT